MTLFRTEIERQQITTVCFTVLSLSLFFINFRYIDRQGHGQRRRTEDRQGHGQIRRTEGRQGHGQRRGTEQTTAHRKLKNEVRN